LLQSTGFLQGRVEELEQVETGLRRSLHDTEHSLLLKEKRIQELEDSLEEERQLQNSFASRYNTDHYQQQLAL
jgi:hypothetical protein